MNVLCYNIEKGLMDSLTLNMIPNGYYIYKTEKENELKKIVYSKMIKIIIADITPNKSQEPDINFIKWISFVDQRNDFKKIFLSNNKESKNISKLMDLGILGFISKKQSTKEIVYQINGIVEKINTSDTRKHVRIAPSEKDNVKAVFYVGSEQISSKVSNISMGGILLFVDDPSILVGVSEKQEIPRIRFEVNNKKIIADSVVVAKRKNLLALKFTELNEMYKETLAKYIFSKLSETNTDIVN